MDLYNNINVTTKEFTKKCNLIAFCNIINNAKVLKKTKKYAILYIPICVK